MARSGMLQAVLRQLILRSIAKRRMGGMAELSAKKAKRIHQRSLASRASEEAT